MRNSWPERIHRRLPGHRLFRLPGRRTQFLMSQVDIVRIKPFLDVARYSDKKQGFDSPRLQKQRNKGRVYTTHKCSSRKRDSFALQNIYFRSHGARNSGGFPRNMVSFLKSRKREASDLPLDASLRKFIAFLSSLPDLPPRADTRTATSPHTR